MKRLVLVVLTSIMALTWLLASPVSADEGGIPPAPFGKELTGKQYERLLEEYLTESNPVSYCDGQSPFSEEFQNFPAHEQVKACQEWIKWKDTQYQIGSYEMDHFNVGTGWHVSNKAVWVWELGLRDMFVTELERVRSVK